MSDLPHEVPYAAGPDQGKPCDPEQCSGRSCPQCGEMMCPHNQPHQCAECGEDFCDYCAPEVHGERLCAACAKIREGWSAQDWVGELMWIVNHAWAKAEGKRAQAEVLARAEAAVKAATEKLK